MMTMVLCRCVGHKLLSVGVVGRACYYADEANVELEKKKERDE